MRYREQRLPCDTEVIAILGEETRHVRFVNISPTGARMEGLGNLPRDALVVITHLGERHAARVVWANDGLAGLRFTMSLSQPEIGHLRRTGVTRPGAWSPPRQHRFRELA